jgi:hypothetical protein
MSRLVVSVLVLAGAVRAIPAQTPEGPIKLSLHPAAAPVPALTYQLLPEINDITPGNAALLYYRALSPEFFSGLRQPGVGEKLYQGRKWPLKELAKGQALAGQAVRPAVRPEPSPLDLGWIKEAHVFREVDLAARREFCDWAFTERIKKEGITMLLPEIQAAHQLAWGVALRARFEMAEGSHKKAIYSLQTGLAMARHIADAPIMINALVGVGIGEDMLSQVEDYIQLPGAPNLYWALTELPRPFIDMRRPIQGEGLWLDAGLPLLRGLEKAHLGPAQLAALREQVIQFARNFQEITGNGKWANPADLAGLVILAMKLYPEAKRELIAQGWRPEAVEELPVLQVVLIRAQQHYQRLADELFKWPSLPFWEALPGILRAQEQIEAARSTYEAFPLIYLLSSDWRNKGLTAAPRLDRRIAALRCVEAIRLYAASHEGKLPATLADIKEVPVPIDPMTSNAFVYTATKSKATLHAPPPAGIPPEENSLTYDLTIAR